MGRNDNKIFVNILSFYVDGFLTLFFLK